MSAPADSPPPAADAAPAEPKPARSVPLALLLAVLVGLAVGGGAGAFAVGPLLAAGIAPAVQANARAAKDAKGHAKPAHGEEGEGEADGGHGDEAAEDEEDGGDEDAGGGEGGHGKEGAGAPVHTLDNLVLNPAESGGTRFLLLSITFELKSAAAAEAFKARDAELRDAVLVTVGNRTVEQLASMGARDSLKADIKTAAKKLFHKSVVKRVYFPQFVIQ